MPDLQQLRQLIAVAEHETLTGAAESLYISHSMLSRSVKKLENELGVRLFEHSKNRICLNECGKIAVEESKKVLSQIETLERRIHEYDISQHTISIAACAPSPLWTLVPLLTDYFPDMPIRSSLQDVERLEGQLLEGSEQLIVMARKLEKEKIFCQKWVDEQLYFSVPAQHPKASAQQLTFSEIGEETILLSANIGCWKHICEKYLPRAHFIVQDNRTDYLKLAGTTSLPVFKTNISGRHHDTSDGRRNIPLVGEGTAASYYCCCLKQKLHLFGALFDSIKRPQKSP